MIKKSGEKCKYHNNKKNFHQEIKKTFFVSFKGLSVVRKCFRPGSGPLNNLISMIIMIIIIMTDTYPLKESILKKPKLLRMNVHNKLKGTLMQI